MEEDGRYVLHRSRWLLVAVFAAGAVTLTVAAVQSTGPSWLYWLGAVASGALTVRALFCARVDASDDGFCYHGVLRNVRREWSDILRFELREVRGSGGGRLVVIVMIERADDSSGEKSLQLNLLNWPARTPYEAEHVRRWLNFDIDQSRRKGQR
jgi:hypothetical protein